MSRVATAKPTATRPDPGAFLELLKPITWFPPMWAFGCGVVSAPAGSLLSWPMVALGVALCGPLVCGTSQVVNDWFDREVDAINEPRRAIPSGRVPGRQGLYFAILWTALSALVAVPFGAFGFGATLVGLALAWAYSAPPARLKGNGWYGNAAVAVCYEGLPWVTGYTIAAGTPPGPMVFALAALYSAGCHGIMTLNDFKSLAGDRRMGIASLPVQLGPERAARLACVVMAVPQLVVIALLAAAERVPYALVVVVLLALQALAMRRLLRDPRALAPWYNGTGVTLYVLGMLVSAFAVRGMPT